MFLPLVYILVFSYVVTISRPFISILSNKYQLGVPCPIHLNPAFHSWRQYKPEENVALTSESVDEILLCDH